MFSLYLITIAMFVFSQLLLQSLQPKSSNSARQSVVFVKFHNIVIHLKQLVSNIIGNMCTLCLQTGFKVTVADEVND